MPPNFVCVCLIKINIVYALICMLVVVVVIVLFVFFPGYMKEKYWKGYDQPSARPPVTMIWLLVRAIGGGGLIGAAGEWWNSGVCGCRLMFLVAVVLVVQPKLSSPSTVSQLVPTSCLRASRRWRYRSPLTSQSMLSRPGNGVRLLGVSTSVVVVVVDIEVVVPALGESSVAGVAGVGVLAAGAGVTGRTVVGDTGGSSCCCCSCIVSRGFDFDFDFGLSMNGSGTG